MNRIFISVLTIFLMVSWAHAQTCTQRLNQAEDDYEAGRLSRVPSQIEKCLADGAFTKEEAIRARKLLTLVYIFSDQEEKADSALVELLKIDPEHQLNSQVDPAELFFLYDQFRTAPIFKLSFRGGINSSYPKVMDNFSVQNNSRFTTFYNGKTADGKKSYEYTDSNDSITNYSSSQGLGIGVWGEIMAEKHVGKGVEVGLGIQGRISNYNIESYLKNSQLKSTLVNNQIAIRTPLLVKYTLNYSNREKKLLPYIFAGISFDYLLSAGYSSARRDGGTTVSYTGTDMISNKQVYRANYSYFGGIGTKIRAKTHFITVEARYDLSMLNYVNGKYRYSDTQSTFDLAFVESNVKLNFISISIGYTFSIHSPKKINDN